MPNGVFVAAPPEHQWEVSLDEVEDWLRQRWPAARFCRRRTLVNPTDYLSFEVDLDGSVRRGAFFDRRNLVLHDGTPEFWAEFIVWFLSCLPSGSRAVGMLEYATDLSPIPLDANREQIAEVFAALSERESSR